MIISLIVATSLNRVIGQENKLPWHMPADLRQFKAKTLGNYLLMGSHTFHSIGRILPNRTSIVVSSKMDQAAISYQVVRSIEEGINFAKEAGASELFVIGGGKVYEQTLPIANRIYLTKIHITLEGDTYFPLLGEEWVQRSSLFCKADTQHLYDYEFIVLEKLEKKESKCFNEDFLHYVWRLQYFNRTDLKTVQGEAIVILNPGLWNKNAGPDFLHATLLINDVEWHGHVELHLQSADWYKHRHHQNTAYDNVILHVVWEDNQPIFQKDKTHLPTLVLKDRVNVALVVRYQELLTQSTVIPCGSQWSAVPPIVVNEMLNSVLLERIDKKSDWILTLLDKNLGDWEETCYQLLAYSFGLKLNEEPFMELSINLPWSILKRYAHDLFQLEAFLFGSAGLYVKGVANDAYITALSKEYDYLQQKHHNFLPQGLNCKWYFARLRPANFPTIRLAQFASLLHQIPCFFDTFITNEVTSFRTQFMVMQSDYWQTHYLPNKSTQKKINGLGIASIDKILINAVAPLLVAYGQYKGERAYSERALNLLRSLPPEKNHILEDWMKIGVSPKNAFDSQSLIHLYNRFCKERSCLSCKIGEVLLHQK